MKKKFTFNRKKFFEDLKYYSLGLYNKFDDDHIWIMSSGVAFNMLICAIPFTLILFSILGAYFSSENNSSTIDSFLNTALGLSPDMKIRIKQIILSKVDEISANRTITAIIGIGGIIWTASGLFSTIRSVLNRIYKAHLEIFYLWGKLKDIGMVFLSTLLFILSFASTTIISIMKAIDNSFFGNTLFGFGFIENLVTYVLGFLFSFLMFYVIYRLVPHGKINAKVVLISSLSSTILWESLKLIFTAYLVNFSDFTAVYGAYAAVVASIFWIYYSSVTFVIGAEIGQLYMEKRLLKAI
ncbi:MAG: YihY/virulence factor BrkB family protein [Ignavibacteriae bacterium]|nr:MAG: YihY/virulence factor BrkB family protein [Ignavibacteriota bacterium]